MTDILYLRCEDPDTLEIQTDNSVVCNIIDQPCPKLRNKYIFDYKCFSELPYPKGGFCVNNGWASDLKYKWSVRLDADTIFSVQVFSHIRHGYWNELTLLSKIEEFQSEAWEMFL